MVAKGGRIKERREESKPRSSMGINDFHIGAGGKLLKCRARSREDCPYHEEESGPRGAEVLEKKARLWEERQAAIADREFFRVEAVKNRFSGRSDKERAEAEERRKEQRRAYNRRVRAQAKARAEQEARVSKAKEEADKRSKIDKSAIAEQAEAWAKNVQPIDFLASKPVATDRVMKRRRALLEVDSKEVAKELKRFSRSKVRREYPMASYKPGYVDGLSSDKVEYVRPIEIGKFGIESEALGAFKEGKRVKEIFTKKQLVNIAAVDALKTPEDNRLLHSLWDGLRNRYGYGGKYEVVAEEFPPESDGWSKEKCQSWRNSKQRHWVYDDKGNLIAGSVGMVPKDKSPWVFFGDEDNNK